MEKFPRIKLCISIFMAFFTVIMTLATIFFLFHGLATNIYENRLDSFETKKTRLIVHVTTEVGFQAIPALIKLQQYKLYLEPKDLRRIWDIVVHRKMHPLPKGEVKDIATIITYAKNELGCGNPSGKKRYNHLENAILEGANFTEGDLSCAILIDAKLKGALFTGGANLKWVNFSRADLEGANFKGANLKGSKFERANLKGANFEQADLRKAEKLTCDQLKQAKNWEKAYRSPTLACGAKIPPPPK